MRRDTRPKFKFRPALHALDHRLLMATNVTASLSGGVLTVIGTSAPDSIVVGVVDPAPSLPNGVVGVWGLSQTFTFNQVKAIRIYGGSGNDAIAVKTIGAATIPSTIDGGPGNNLINGVWDVPPAPVTPPASVLSAAEQRIVDLTNVARQQAGLAPLKVNIQLVKAAQLQSANMARLNTLSHDLPGTSTPGTLDRIASVGYKYSLLGENIAFNYPNADAVVAGWLGSPAHQANMLNGFFTEIGVSVAYSASGNPYYSMELTRPA